MHRRIGNGEGEAHHSMIFLMDHSRPLFLYFRLFEYTVDSIQMFDINKFLPLTGFEPRTLVSEATALPTEPQPLPMFN